MPPADAARPRFDLGGRVALVPGVLDLMGRVDIVVNNAGIIRRADAAARQRVGGKGVNVNANAPGYMRTDNTRALAEDPVRYKQILDRIPAGRWGDPDDLGGAVVFLASEAADHVHGHVLVVDGGWMGR
jgi:2-deoxy-D-gluconate 3-dehydrogenase